MFSRFCHLLPDITSDGLNSAVKHYQSQDKDEDEDEDEDVC